METTKNAIYSHWLAMLISRKIPCFEILLNNGDYLVADVNYTQGDDFISFSFNESYPVYFDSSIKKHGCEYYIMLDVCFCSLDSYLQLIHDNIIEGYIIPNDLMLCEDE